MGKYITIGIACHVDHGKTSLVKAKKDILVSSICTVFAESEVTSLLARDEDRRDTALGLHHSVVMRAAGMLERVTISDPVLFAGGVARNPYILQILQEATGKETLVPDEPQMVGALGAAIMASKLQQSWTNRLFE